MRNLKSPSAFTVRPTSGQHLTRPTSGRYPVYIAHLSSLTFFIMIHEAVTLLKSAQRHTSSVPACEVKLEANDHARAQSRGFALLTHTDTVTDGRFPSPFLCIGASTGAYAKAVCNMSIATVLHCRISRLYISRISFGQDTTCARSNHALHV